MSNSTRGFVTLAYGDDGTRRAIRIAHDGAVSLMVTGANGYAWSHETAIEAETASQLVEEVTGLTEQLVDADGQLVIGHGEAEDQPETWSVDLEALSEDGRMLVERMRSMTEDFLAEHDDWAAPEPGDGPPVVGPSPGAFGAWTGGFFAVLLVGFLAPMFAVFVALRRLGMMGERPDWAFIVAALAPLVVAVVFYVLGRRYGRRYPEHRNPLLPAAIAVGVPGAFYLAVTPEGFGFCVVSGLAVLPFVAFWGARSVKHPEEVSRDVQ